MINRNGPKKETKIRCSILFNKNSKQHLQYCNENLVFFFIFLNNSSTAMHRVPRSVSHWLKSNFRRNR